MKIAIEIMGLPFWRLKSRKDSEGNIVLSCEDIDEFIQKDYQRLKNGECEIKDCLFGRRNG